MQKRAPQTHMVCGARIFWVNLLFALLLGFGFCPALFADRFGGFLFAAGIIHRLPALCGGFAALNRLGTLSNPGGDLSVLLLRRSVVQLLCLAHRGNWFFVHMVEDDRLRIYNQRMYLHIYLDV